MATILLTFLKMLIKILWNIHNTQTGANFVIPHFIFVCSSLVRKKQKKRKKKTTITTTTVLQLSGFCPGLAG